MLKLKYAATIVGLSCIATFSYAGCTEQTVGSKQTTTLILTDKKPFTKLVMSCSRTLCTTMAFTLPPALRMSLYRPPLTTSLNVLAPLHVTT